MLLNNVFSTTCIIIALLLQTSHKADALLNLARRRERQGGRLLLLSKDSSKDPNTQDINIDTVVHNKNTLGINDDCCDKCADDEACKIDKNGCECWKAASVSSSTSDNYSFLKFKAGIYAPNGVYNVFNGIDGTGSTVANGEGDCCDKCADDEACKVDKNGCECWKPVSSLLQADAFANAMKVKGINFISKISKFAEMRGCCVGTHSSDRVTRECAAFSFNDCSNGLAHGSRGETCFWDSSRICLEPSVRNDNTENGEGCCISTQDDDRVRRECARFNQQQCNDGQGSNGETCYWSDGATCPRDQIGSTNINGCCVGTDSSERVALECGVFSYGDCSNGLAQGSGGETCYWDSSRECLPANAGSENTDTSIGCCISTQSSEQVMQECARFDQDECNNSQGSNGETCYWSADATCPRHEKNDQHNGEMIQASDDRITATSACSRAECLVHIFVALLLLH